MDGSVNAEKTISSFSNKLSKDKVRWRGKRPKFTLVALVVIAEQCRKICWIVVRILLLLVCLYFFVCSLDLLSASFRLIGGKAAGSVFKDSKLLANPIACLMIGVLATVLVQSSSTSTSIVVTMANSGLLEIQYAIYIIMGANIGTSITNTLVAVIHGNNRDEFRRAFAGATVHDMFNWLNVFVLLPVEVLSTTIFGKGYLNWITAVMLDTGSGRDPGKVEKLEMLSLITDPLVKSIIQLDKSTIEAIAKSQETNATIAKHYCGPDWCPYLFNADLSDAAIGGILLVVSLFVLIGCLLGIVKILNSCLEGRVAKAIKKTVNADFRYPFGWLTAYAAMAAGALFTFIIQSSSVFTSALTPLVGIGVLSLERVYPLTLGSNVGTTGTAIIAALATDNFRTSLQVALCHLVFNVTGIIIWYPVPWLRQCPLSLARFLGETTAEYRWFALAYVLGMFLFFPLLVFGLSAISWIALLVVGVPVVLLVITVTMINWLQKHKPDILPSWLKTWAFLPEPLRSLKPLDRLISRLMSAIRKCMKPMTDFCKCCRCKRKVVPMKDAANSDHNTTRVETIV